MQNNVEIKELIKFLKNIGGSIKNLKLHQVNLTNYEQFYEIFSNLEELNHLELEDCNWDHPWNVAIPIVSKMRSVSLKECSSGCLISLKSFKNLEKIKSGHLLIYRTYNFELNNLLMQVPSIQHLILEGAEDTFYLKNPSFNFSLSLKLICQAGLLERV